MKNPIYVEYKRSTILGCVLVITLSALAALVQSLSSVDEQVISNKAQLDSASRQFDSQMSPLLGLATALRKVALLKLSLSSVGSGADITILSLTTAETEKVAITDENVELAMLAQLQPYFDVITDTHSALKSAFYLSEQGFAFNGASKWSDYRVEALIKWRNQRSQAMQFNSDLIFEPRFTPELTAMVIPLVNQGKTLGNFIFLLDNTALLTSLFADYPALDLMLLDQSGAVILASSTQRPQSVEQHLLQVQRLETVPWSLALIERKTKVFAAGIADFFWHWFAYASVLAIFFLLVRYRYKTRTLSPVSRLLVHIERLAQGQNRGVRHIPNGWSESFDKVYQIKEHNADVLE